MRRLLALIPAAMLLVLTALPAQATKHVGGGQRCTETESSSIDVYYTHARGLIRITVFNSCPGYATVSALFRDNTDARFVLAPGVNRTFYKQALVHMGGLYGRMDTGGIGSFYDPTAQPCDYSTSNDPVDFLVQTDGHVVQHPCQP